MLCRYPPFPPPPAPIVLPPLGLGAASNRSAWSCQKQRLVHRMAEAFVVSLVRVRSCSMIHRFCPAHLLVLDPLVPHPPYLPGRLQLVNGREKHEFQGIARLMNEKTSLKGLPSVTHQPSVLRLALRAVCRRPGSLSWVFTQAAGVMASRGGGGADAWFIWFLGHVCIALRPISCPFLVPPFGNAAHAVCTQHKVLYVSNCLNPNFSPFSQVSCSIMGFFYASCALRMGYI